MPKKNQITYLKPDPPFLRRIREKIGYQEGPNIDTKKESLGQADEKELEDQNDEKPTVVITDNPSVSKEEQEDFAEKIIEVKPTKIVFKKPVKKEETQENSITNQSNLKQSNLKRPLEEDTKSKLDEEKSKKSKQKEKNSRLLSFGDEDEDF